MKKHFTQITKVTYLVILFLIFSSGNAEVSLKDGELFIQFIPTPTFNATLTHWHYDTFEIVLKNYPSLPEGKANFVLDANGDVEEMRIDIPNPDFYFTELEFKKLN